MKLLPLSQNKQAQVSDEDYERVSQFKWTATCNPNGRRKGGREKWYAVRTESRENRRVRVYLHRYLVDCPSGMVVDHIDGDGLNCQRENLAVVTQKENTQSHRRKPRTEDPEIFL